MQQILPLLLDENGLSLKFRRKVKSKDSRLKSKVKSKFASKPKEKVCKLWWCKNNDSMPCKRLTKTRFWQAKKGLREATETLNILTTVSLSQQQVDYLMTFVMIMIKVKSRFILISKQITNTLQDLLPTRMMQTRKINLETDKITPNAEVFR